MSKRIGAFLLFLLAGFLIKVPVAGSIYQGEFEPIEQTPKEFLQNLVDKKDFEIIHNIIACESSWKENAHNPKTNDVGLMQINVKYHLKKSLEMGYDIYDWKDNLRYGYDLYKKDGKRPWKASERCWVAK